MKIIKSTRQHKMHSKFALIAEFDWTTQELREYGQMCRAFEQRFGPSALNDWDQPVNFNPNWRKENKVKNKRRRIYFKDMKDWTWAQLSK